MNRVLFNYFVNHKKPPRPHRATRGLWEWRGQDSNLRPRGYEPRELPDCSTPRHVRVVQEHRESRLGTLILTSFRRPSIGFVTFFSANCFPGGPAGKILGFRNPVGGKDLFVGADAVTW